MDKIFKIYKEEIFTKVKESLFNKKQEEQIIPKNILVIDAKEKFKNRIKIEEDEQKKKILKLQEDYKNGRILEKDISNDDYEELIKLYEEQNRQLKEKIQTKKIQIRRRLDSLKVS